MAVSAGDRADAAAAAASRGTAACHRRASAHQFADPFANLEFCSDEAVRVLAAFDDHSRRFRLLRDAQ